MFFWNVFLNFSNVDDRPTGAFGQQNRSQRVCWATSLSCCFSLSAVPKSRATSDGRCSGAGPLKRARALRLRAAADARGRPPESSPTFSPFTFARCSALLRFAPLCFTLLLASICLAPLHFADASPLSSLSGVRSSVPLKKFKKN